MKTAIEINNLTKKRIDPEFVKKIVRKTAKLSGADFKLLELSIVFVSEPEMRKINRKCKKKNKSTDVLSFNFDLGYNKKRKAIEGELVLCPDVIAKNARKNEVEFSCEFVFVLSHGVLHVLGWRHSARMYQLQDKICGKL